MMQRQAAFKLLILTALAYLIPQTYSLTEIPKDVKVSSELVFSKSGKYAKFQVEEFIDCVDGNLHISVLNTTSGSKENQAVHYYRIKQKNLIKDPLGDDTIVAFQSEDYFCLASTEREWLLAPYSDLISDLGNGELLADLELISKDRTSLGPIRLMRIVHANANQFKLTMKAFDPVKLVDVYYFITTVTLVKDKRIKIYCTVPFWDMKNKKELQIGKTTLADIETHTDAYISKIGAIYTDHKGDKLALKDLIADDTLRGVIVNYLLVQNIGLADRKDLNLFSSGASEVTPDDPFRLPSGAGCGSWSMHTSLYINAKQFSGRYEINGRDGERFVAFDSATSFLRLDSIGQNKILYDLKQKSATYIADASTLIGNQPPVTSANQMISSKSNVSQFEDSAHCSKTLLRFTEDTQVGLFNAHSMEDIMGFQSTVGVSYLGQMVLEDGTHCLVFEREITPDRVPVLMSLAMTIDFMPSSRLFLTYYLVSEVSMNTNDTSFRSAKAYQSMWLKRIDLSSRAKPLKFGILNGRVTFSESSWSLESIGEDTKGRFNHIRHPVRTFDTSECKSDHEKIELELIVKQTSEQAWLWNTASGFDYQPDRQSNEIYRGIESLEEGIMYFLVRRTGLPRSSVTELEVFVVPKLNQGQGAEERMILIKSKLVGTLKYRIERYLIGWIKTADVVVTAKRATMIASSGMTIHECSLSLGTRLHNFNELYMLYCPNFGCGYLHEMDKVDYIKSDTNETVGPTTKQYYYMCEIYIQVKKGDLDMSLSTNISPRSLDKNLNLAPLSLEMDDISNSTFKGVVSRLSARKASLHESLASPILSGICYTSKTGLIFGENKKNDNVRNNRIRVIELKLNQHQSVIHCHKACALSVFCMSHSYDKSTNTCHLSSIDTDLLFNDESSELTETREDENCDIYTLNSIHLYKYESNTQTTPASLSNRNFHFEKRDLNGCANLCRKYELLEFEPGNVSTKFECNTFHYMPTTSLCAIEDPKFYLMNETFGSFEQSDRSFYNKKHVDPSQWYTAHHFQVLKLELDQFYSGERCQFKMELKQPAASVEQADDKITDRSKSAASPILYGLSPQQCLYECAFLNEVCVAADYCVEYVDRVMSVMCFMYHIRSPQSLGLDYGKLKLTDSANSTLTELEKLYYLDGRSKEHNATMSNRQSCTHHFMGGDHLSLKRQLAPLIVELDIETQIRDIESEHLNLSEKFTSSLKKFIKTHGKPSLISGGGRSFLGVTFQLFLGALIGSLLFIYLPTIGDSIGNANYRMPANLIEALADRWHQLVGSPARARSSSRVVLSEANEDIRLSDLPELSPPL